MTLCCYGPVSRYSARQRPAWMCLREFGRVLVAASLTVTFCGVLSCRPALGPAGPFQRKMLSWIHSNCSGTTECDLKLTAVADFDWDRMFAFKYTATQADIERALGAPFPGYYELQGKIVFVNGRQVVLREDVPTDVERPLPDELAFDIPDRASYKAYGRDAAFRVTQVPVGNGVYYFLKEAK